MISAEKSIYISYSWKKERRKKTVEKIMAAFSAVGVEVKRDEKEIGYGDPIRAYMDELAAGGGAIILVLSEPYIKSPNCMYELLEIYNHDRKKFCERIFPVVLKGTRFHNATDRLPYIQFWEEETKKLNSSFDDVYRTNIGIASHQELRKYVEVSYKIDDLLSLIGDMNHLKEEDHLKDNFSALIERIFPALPPSGGGGTDKTGHEKTASNQSVDIDQNIVGNGNISSGGGNVNINNLHIYAAETKPPPEKTAFPISPAKLGTLFGVPDPPPNHFDRPEYLDQLRAAVLQGDTQAVGTTGKRQYVGVLGMGGLGKSVLAAALAHDEAVRAAFPDGIFWLRFRRDADDAYLLEQQAEILKIIAPGQLPDTLVNGENLLTLALENKRCLFIADDIWDSGQLYHFKLKSKHCRLLLTTRKAEVIKKINAVPCELGLLSEPQARQFLAVCSGFAENDLPEEAAAIVQECGRLPLALAAIGSMVKGKPAKRWQMALEKLQNACLDKIPADLTLDYEYKNLFKVFQVSVEDLPPEVQTYYKTLIIFPEDAQIPESVLQLYWEHCPQGDYEPLEAVDLLVARSLLSREKDEFVTLHDLLRDYLIFQSGCDMANLHKQLLETYKAKHPNEWHDDLFVLNDMLKDYLIFKSGCDMANLHKQLLEAYKAEYPGGWHTISTKDNFYFQKNWWNHAVKARIEVSFVEEITSDLMTNNPLDHVPAFISVLRYYDEFLCSDYSETNEDTLRMAIAKDEQTKEIQRSKKKESADLLIKMRGLLDQLPAENKDLISNLFPNMRILKKNDPKE